MKLVHAADLHLGRRRLDGRLPDTDFRDAFARIADVAIGEAADAVLLAGDLFDQAQVQPAHLRQAQEVLGRLKNAAIPVLAIEGNHDRSPNPATQPSWLDYLAEDDFLRLLAIRFGPDGPRLEPWNPATRRGAFLDLHGLRFVGAGYLGAATPLKIRQIVERLDPGKAHVLLLHAGPDYFVGDGGGFSREDLQTLRQHVAYLALGHIHKPMIHGDWACNPGSPEHCELHEARYDRDVAGNPVPRGYARIELDPGPPARVASLSIQTLPRRPVIELELDCTPFGNKLKGGAEALVGAAATAIQAARPSPEAVVLLSLAGHLNLRRIALDPDLLPAAIEQRVAIAAVALDLSRLNLPSEGSGPQTPNDGLPRDYLERQAIRAALEHEPLWGLEDARNAIAELFHDLKEQVRHGHAPDTIADHLARNPLVDRIRAAQTSPPPPPEAAPPDPVVPSATPATPATTASEGLP